MSDDIGGLDRRFGRPAGEVHGIDGHPASEKLSAYQAGELPPEEHDALQEHVVSCALCAERLLDLERFLAVPGKDRPAEGVADFVTAAEWRRLREKLVFREKEKRDRGLLQSPLAASLILGILGIPLLTAVWWISHLRGEITGLQGQVAGLRDQVNDLRQPLVNVPTTDLMTTRGETQELSFGSTVRLNLRTSAPVQYPEYLVEISNSEGRVIWSGTVRRDDGTALGLTIIAGFLRPGTYQIHLAGRREGRAEPLEDFTIRVVPR